MVTGVADTVTDCNYAYSCWESSISKMNTVCAEYPPLYPRLQLNANMPPQMIADIIIDLKQQRRAVDEKRATVLDNLNMTDDDQDVHDDETSGHVLKKRKAETEIHRPVAEFARLFVGNVVPGPLCS
ncbi:hypothetical protein SDRG_04646 [Saprolegnia diclina VS20]|uniref:Uncharacterized protein n=1 Tax=Saprolegnia diclina (strain VS20) TaxID=1156394 RepID=T0QJK4_SAPDV|nr:hypothetical protein SDRG_04646 [Saprolegnia diclina VS20]EQC38219.1 hypothetical protein SDRG_04646 [Saprolegnia diclina VS20]|eukprot:XP_008608546.1 hypothetical protein SDRG_04646 [Saprolegnia diclina VS20]